MKTKRTDFNPLFCLGRIMATPGALEACSMVRLTACLARHACGDWGCADPEDQRANNEALRFGERILSAWPIDSGKPCTGPRR